MRKPLDRLRAGKRLEWIVYVTAAVWVVGSIALFTRRTSLGVLLTLPLLLCYLVALVIGIERAFAQWRQRRWGSLIPLGVLVAALTVARVSVRVSRHLLFVWSLPSYEALIHRIESGRFSVPPGVHGVTPIEGEARLAHWVLAEKTANGVLMVTFATEYRGGYLYSSSGRIEPGSQMDSHWPGRTEVRKCWFTVGGS